ncbi:hypothetical protein [Rhodopirellula europaea]|jgi:hypothetical protein|uniref:Uncharacterized protein n=1 Tax=Rhodopirellula europaea SH398 TaxID=1263868 RepID=M5S0Q3_9BACT|nr:hypothetical protein [Rhodopirellula europaea]EMI25135.1 hypothetical protein RESH_04288 [Rhodopirellula europaea SH398]
MLDGPESPTSVASETKTVAEAVDVELANRRKTFQHQRIANMPSINDDRSNTSPRSRPWPVNRSQRRLESPEDPNGRTANTRDRSERPTSDPTKDRAPKRLQPK